MDLSEAIQHLQKEHLEGKVEPPVAALPLAAIRVLPEAFQPRDTDYEKARSDAHKKVLAEAIKDNERHTLDPITVWHSGQHWYVIDGHHRLAAYQLVAKKHPEIKLGDIPVRTFVGTIHEAIMEASKSNCRDKLPMRKDDKIERAWKLVCMDQGWTREQIRDASGASIRTIASMRAKRKELIESRQNTGSELLDMMWWQANSDGSMEQREDDWKEKQAIKWAERLAKAFGTKFAEQPEIAAMALEHYSERLVVDLIKEWPHWRAAVEAEEEEEEYEDCDF